MSSDESRDPLRTPPKKKQKRLTFYNKGWEKDEEYKDWLRQKDADNTSARCLWCTKTFSVKFEGVGAVKAHFKSKTHQNSALSQKSSQKIKEFLNVENSNKGMQVAKREVASVYHNVRHGLSYNSLDCTHKLLPVLFSDSQIAKKIHCGRTKSAAIAQSVLGPHSESILVNDLKTAEYFSIASDATSKGFVRMYPCAVQFFSRSKGICQGVLDFYFDAQEGHEDIYAQLERIVNAHQIGFNKISSYSADNAPVNYGRWHSVYQKLKEKNGFIVKANCNCHVLHNSVKHSLPSLSYDVEGLVLKVYSEFSGCPQNCEELNKFFEFVELQYCKILRHVPTRWLSLLAAVERLLQCWPAIKSYFMSQDKKNLHKIVKKFVFSCSDDDAKSEGIAECYLYFIHNVMQELDAAVKKLEAKEVCASEIYSIMSAVLNSIQSRISDKFYGIRASQISSTLEPSAVNKFNKEANLFLKKMESYLQSNFDFSEGNILYSFGVLNCKENTLSFSFRELCSLYDKSGISVDQDKLYAEFVNLRANYCTLLSPEMSVSRKWLKFFETHESPLLFKLISFVLSIPVSNAYAERVFSMMKHAWTDQRNSMSASLLKAELQIRLNYDMSCVEFFNFLGKEENVGVLQKARGVEKYQKGDKVDAVKVTA